MEIVPIALSDREGDAELTILPNSELGSLLIGERSGDTERVRVSTLDVQARSLGWSSIDLIKIDAEGEEANIVRGGRRLLSETSPLVMIELKHAAQLNLPALAELEALGYSLFRLIGPDSLLVPFRSEEPIDPYELNVFAAKPDRAAKLEVAGRLLRTVPVDALPAGMTSADAADSYARWCDGTLLPIDRYCALRASLAIMSAIPEERRTPPQLSTLARVARDAGCRQVAFEALLALVERLDDPAMVVDGPFHAPLARFDSLDRRADPTQWLRAAATEGLELTRSLSSYFVPGTILPRLDWLQSTRFASAPIERRRQLQRLRAGEQRDILPHWTLRDASPDNLNPGLWAPR